MCCVEEFDEAQFCRYYLKLYQKLRELDRNKVQGLKFSKAFSEFTVLVYHNMFGPNGLETVQKQQAALDPRKLSSQGTNGGKNSTFDTHRASVTRSQKAYNHDKEYKRVSLIE